MKHSLAVLLVLFSALPSFAKHHDFSGAYNPPVIPDPVVVEVIAPVFAQLSGHASGDIYIPSNYKLIFGDITTTDVAIQKTSANTITVNGNLTCTGATCGGLPPGPTTPDNVTQTLNSTPSGGVAGADVWGLPGVPTNPQTGTTYTIAAKDRASYVTFSNGSAIAVTLPNAASAGFGSNFVMVACDIGAGTATITPTISTISYSTGSAYTSAASSMALTTGQCAWVYSNGTDYFAIQRTGGISGLTTGSIPKAGSATSIVNSLCDEGITTTNTVTCTDTAGIAAPKFTATGTTAGYFQCTQGTANGHATANTITDECPTSVTAYEFKRSGAAATGLPLWTNAASVVTQSVLTSTVAGDVLVGDGTTWTMLGGNTSGTKCLTETSSGVASWGTCGGGTTTYPVTVAGTVNSGGIPYFNSTTQESSSAALTANIYVKGGGAGAAPTPGLTTDDGTTSTYTGTGGTKSPVFTATGTSAGFVDYPQGTTSAAVAPCNTATSICEQAPTAVTSYLVTKPGVSATGIYTNNVSAAVITQGISGDANHSATVTIGSGTSIGSTQLCSSANCPAGTYVVHVYVDITTACGTTGTYIVNLIYTDDQGAKTAVVNLNGTGSVPATGTLTTTSTANYGENAQVLRLTSGNLNYSTTATACGSAGPMVGKLYMAAVPVM